MKNRYFDIQNTQQNLDQSGRDVRELKFSNPSGTIRLGTSFSGIGAIEYAFRRLGLNCEIKFAGDIDEYCKQAYFANYNISEDQWHTDVHNFSALPYKGQIDLLVGGAPCQAFSLRGKHGGFEDTRGTLFSEFARLIIECQPKVFIFENVKGMLTHDRHRTWNVIRKTFEDDCNYDVYFQVLNGKDYGVPQSRERLYCIGFKKETDFKYPAPFPLEKSVYDYLDDEFSVKYLLKQKGVHFITESINHKKSYTQINGDIMLCQKRNQQFNWHGDFLFFPHLKDDPATPETDEHLFRLADCEEDYYKDKDPEKYTIKKATKGHYKFTKVDPSLIDTSMGRFRKFTSRECLRLMGFQDDFKIVVPDSATYKQAGNSIIVDVLMYILRQIDITRYAE